MYNLNMKNISNSSIGYIFYVLGAIDYVSANFFDIDLTGLPFSPLIFGGIGSIFIFIHNSKIKDSNNNVYELFKFCLFAVLISDDIINESELEYSTSILNTLENELLLPTNPSKLEQEILNYDLNSVYENIKILESTVQYQAKLNILSSCAILCVMDGQIDEVEQESIYKISNILNISEIDMKNIFNASIASYINFTNSGREKLQINDSEVKKVVDQKKAENKSNKNQVFIGLVVFSVLVISGIYTSFQVTPEESCDNLLSTWNLVDSLESDFIALNDQVVTIWNEYVTYQLEDEYLLLTAEQQKETHRNMNLYLIDTLSIKEQDVITEISNITFTEDSIHQEHIELYVLLNDVINTQLIKFSLINKNTQDSVTYISVIENYYEEWDSAFSVNDVNLMEDLNYNFFEVYDPQWTENFISNNNEIDRNISIITSKVDSYAELSLSICGHTYER